MDHWRLYKKEWRTSVHSLKSQQPMGTNILVAPKSLHQTLINVISPSMFNLNRIGNGYDNISSEEHFKNLKIKRGSFFTRTVICVQILNSIS